MPTLTYNNHIRVKMTLSKQFTLTFIVIFHKLLIGYLCVFSHRVYIMTRAQLYGETPTRYFWMHIRISQYARDMYHFTNNT